MAMSGVGCGGSSSGSALPNLRGVYGADMDVPGFGPSRLVVSVGPGGKGRVSLFHENRLYSDLFQPTGSSTTLTDTTVALRPDSPSRVSVRSGSTGAEVEVETDGTVRRMTLSRLGDFAQSGDTPPVTAGSRYAVLTGDRQVVIQVNTVAADSMGGWSLEGLVTSSGGTFAFGGPLWKSDLVGDILSIVSEGGMILSGEFGKDSPTGSVLSFYGIATGPLTKLD